MVVKQVAFEIPNWVQNGIENGNLKIFNGVVRDSKGRIVHHLKEAMTKGDDKKSLVIAGVVAVATLTAVTGTYVLKRLSKKKNKNYLISNFNNSIVEYLVAAKDMSINNKVIDALYDSLEGLRQALQKSNKQSNIEEHIDMKKFNEIIDSVYKYTLELAKNNEFDKVEIKRTSNEDIESNIIDLQEYLKLQKDLLKNCG